MDVIRLHVDRERRGKALGDLFGIFFEDLNHAADGGLYAEMVQNRSFAYAPVDRPEYHALWAWEKLERGGSQVEYHTQFHDTRHPNNPNYMVLEVVRSGQGGGVRNIGYDPGMSIQEGEIYRFRMYAKRLSSFDAPLEVRLETKDGKCLAASMVHVACGDWTKYTLELRASDTSHEACLVLLAKSCVRLAIDTVSLFPMRSFPEDGQVFRQDLAEMLAEMKPKFLRFPGGCLVHDGTLDAADRNSMYRWKNTLGRAWNRPSKRNNWGYNQSLGLGFYEYFLLAEAIHAKPLPVLPAGYDPHHRRAVPMDELEPWIQDALDLIDFANGPADSPWGQVRREMGHPEPFGLEYLAIGNEEVGEDFFLRYAVFHERITQAYPEIKLINSASPFAAGGEYERGWASAEQLGSELIDEHYYCSPEWYLANMDRYENFDPKKTKVFLGEYASWGNEWRNALIEAAYMTHLEKAPAVALACYAPLFCNVNYRNWQPDLIWFDNHRVYGTPNYYVQKLFMLHQGDTLLDLDVSGMPEAIVIPCETGGEIRIAATNAAVRYTDMRLTVEGVAEPLLSIDTAITPESQTIGRTGSDFSLDFTITRSEENLVDTPWSGRGAELRFAYQDEENYMSLQLGAWQNQDCMIHQRIAGRGTDLTQSLFTMDPNVSYRCSLRVEGDVVSCVVDGRVIAKTVLKPQRIEALYYSSSIDSQSEEVIVKLVNVRDEAVDTVLELPGMTRGEAKRWTMAYEANATNSLDDPECVIPVYETTSYEDGELLVSLQPRSVNILRLENR